MSSLPPSETPDPNQPDCCGVNIRQEKDRAVLPERKTRRSILFGGSAFILAAIVFWRPVQQRFLTYLLLRTEAPSEEVLSGAVQQAGNPSSLLMGLWMTQRIPQRQFVLSYLSRVSTSKPDLFRSLEPLVLEAVEDPDITTRESAFAALMRVKHPQLRALAREQLSDADPAARLMGLQTLRGIADSNDVSIAMRLLDDPEPRVVVAAALVLRQATGQDFGIRTGHALPQFTCIETNPPPAPDLPAINRGVQRWHEWWSRHQTEFPIPSASPVVHRRAARLATANFTLEDSAGKPVKLSQFRGKTVLLSFWSLGSPASLDDAPALTTLQQRNPDSLAVVGICVPAAPSCADEHEHGHDHANHHHDESTGGGAGREHMTCFVLDAAKRLKINYPMLVDTKGAIGLRFNIEDLPAYVLIDSDGMVRRRFVGFRTEQALTAMVVEALKSLPTKVNLSAGMNRSDDQDRNTGIVLTK